MSGPNTDYDPVEVTPLHPEQVAAARDEALAAVTSTLDEQGSASSAFVEVQSAAPYFQIILGE